MLIEALAGIWRHLSAVTENLSACLQDPDDETLARFLKATNADVPKSCKMYVQHRMWRKTFVPKGYISEPEISGQLSAQKVFLQVKDGMRPVLVIQVQKHDAHNRDLEEFKRELSCCHVVRLSYSHNVILRPH